MDHYFNNWQLYAYNIMVTTIWIHIHGYYDDIFTFGKI